MPFSPGIRNNGESGIYLTVKSKYDLIELSVTYFMCICVWNFLFSILKIISSDKCLF